MTCCATHTALERLRDEPQRVIDEHRLWGCRYAAVGGFIRKDHSYTAQDWLDFAASYNAIAGRFEGSGLSLGYHHHSHELARYGGARTALDVLCEKLSPSVWIEVDTYWIAHGGGDPAAWISRAATRQPAGVPVVHLKDMAVKPDRTAFMAEVGGGNLNWPAVLRACRDGGVEWLVVEQDTCPGDPFDSLALSLRNLRAMGLK
jgi:sugar phosphate isomerase/epimerase